MASYQDPLDVVIIGGSLGGLTAAITLKSLPNVASVTVLERLKREELQDLGAGIRLGDEIISSIREYTGTPPEKYARRLETVRFLDEQGEERITQPIQMWSTTWTQMYRTMKRSLDESSKCTYRMECEVNRVEEIDTKTVSVSFRTSAGVTETVQASLVIAADGPSSRIRQLMQPDARRKSAGYVLYRGVIEPEECSNHVRDLARAASVFSFLPSSQIVTYEVPGYGGSADEVPSLINWVWYQNKTEQEIATLLTDESGSRHQFSLPPGGMAVGEIEKLRETARQTLPATYYGEILAKTKQPFVQVVTDSAGGDTSFFDGKLMIIGDAVGGQRPHTAAATTLGAVHSLLLKKMLRGHADREASAQKIQETASVLVDAGKKLGVLCMSADHGAVKVPAYMPLFMGAVAQLNKAWQEALD